MFKKSTTIAIFVTLGVVLIGLSAYYFILKNKETTGTSTQTNSGFKGFFPFGNSGSYATPTYGTPAQTTTNETSGNSQNFAVKLRELSREPVSGAGLLDLKAGTVVRYIERATGHIFEVELFSPNQNRISNTTIPLIYEAYWGNKNLSLLARSLKDDAESIDTFSLMIKPSGTSTENSVTSVAFPQNITDVSVFGSNVFYLVQNGDSSLGFVSTFDGKNKKQIWSSPIKDLLSQFVNASTVSLTTKPHQNIPGFMYFVDTTTGGVRKVLGDIAGLSTITSPDASRIFFLKQDSGDSSFVFDSKTQSSKNISPATFPEKCLWSKKDKDTLYCAVPRENLSEKSLDSWYLGQTSFNDDIWKYNLKDNTSSIVMNLSDDSGAGMDVLRPLLSENEQYIVFINKKDNSLWSLDLTK